MSKKHFIVTFENDKAQTTKTLAWARENYSKYNEQTKEQEVYIYLVDKEGFRLTSDSEKFVCYKFDYVKKHIHLNIENDVIIIEVNYFGFNNYFIEFSIGTNNYKLQHNVNIQNSVLLHINGVQVARGQVRAQLDNIALLLGLGQNWIYDVNGIHKTTHTEANQLYHYIINNY
jgi:hypothetical protein